MCGTSASHAERAVDSWSLDDYMNTQVCVCHVNVILNVLTNQKSKDISFIMKIWSTKEVTFSYIPFKKEKKTLFYSVSV